MNELQLLKTLDALHRLVINQPQTNMTDQEAVDRDIKVPGENLNKRVLENVEFTSLDKEIEQMAMGNKTPHPRVSLDDILANIKHIEISKYVTVSGRIMRWAIITTQSGFGVTGDPSVSFSPENDSPETGEKVAIQNALDRMWGYMGYELSCRLANKK